MAYSGSTATTPNPPFLIARGLSNQLAANSTSVARGNGWWAYNSTNLSTDLFASNFFTDAKTLGMLDGDVVIAATYAVESSTSHVLVIGMVTGVSTSGARLSTGGSITSTFG